MLNSLLLTSMGCSITIINSHTILVDINMPASIDPAPAPCP